MVAKGQSISEMSGTEMAALAPMTHVQSRDQKRYVAEEKAASVKIKTVLWIRTVSQQIYTHRFAKLKYPT